MLFRSALGPFYQFEPERIGEPGRVIVGSRGLAAMLFDDSTAANPGGDLFVRVVACLDQDVACYEKKERGR